MTQHQPPVLRNFTRRLRDLLLSRGWVRICWCVNVLALVGSAVWITQDGKFPDAVTAFHRHVSAIGSDNSPLAVVPPLLWPRVDALWAMLGIALVSAIGIGAGLAAGAGQHRNTRAWLAATLLLAGWLTLLTTWPQLVWQGQVWRVRASLPQFAAVAERLSQDWPQDDGDIPELGPFMAYPIGNPRTLMLMTTPRVPGTRLEVKVIERGEHESIYFQLAGNDEGVWLVRQPTGDEPRSFSSGLDGEYIPVEFRPVRPGWLLVRFIYAPTVLGDPAPARQPR